MTPDTTACPHCGGAPKGPPDTHGVRACSRCTRSWLPDGRSVGSPARRYRLLPVVAGLAMAAAVGASVAVLVGPSEEGPEVVPVPAEPAPVPVATPPEAAPLPAEARPALPMSEAPPLEPVIASTADHPQATWTLHRRVTVGDNTWHLGTLRNDSQDVLDHPVVYAVFMDAADGIAGVHSGFALREHLDPGEESPVRVLVRDPEPHVREVYVASTRAATWVPDPVQGLVVLSEEPAEDPLFGWRFSGLVRHDGEVPARHVKVEVTAWDASGRLGGVVETYADTEVLEPGQTAPFSSTAQRIEGEPARVEYAVHASLADQPAEPEQPEAPMQAEQPD